MLFLVPSKPAPQAANLYASYLYNSTIHAFGPTGTDLGTFGNTGGIYPEGVAFDTHGNLYVVNSNPPGTIHKFGPSGADLGTIVNGTVLGSPIGIAIDSLDNLYVSDIELIGQFFSFDFMQSDIYECQGQPFTLHLRHGLWFRRPYDFWLRFLCRLGFRWCHRFRVRLRFGGRRRWRYGSDCRTSKVGLQLHDGGQSD